MALFCQVKLLAYLGLLFSGSFLESVALEPFSNTPTQINRFQEALDILSHSSLGKELIQKGLKSWNLNQSYSLFHFFQWSEVSRTETILTRHLDPKSGQEDRERRILIYLKENQTTPELVLDLAHELVHATTRPNWDPYDPTLTPGRYIHAAIEGIGGEIEAVIKECQIGIELSKKLGKPLWRCQKYLRLSGLRINRDQVKRDFYRVGKWQAHLKNRLGAERQLFPLLSQKNPTLYSSTGHAPYPLALLKEYEDLTAAACENSRKRIPSFMDSKALAYQATLEFLQKRCGFRD